MDLMTAHAQEPTARTWAGRLVGTRKALVGWTIASLIGNILIIVTGGVVRLTGSGLGCPTWPQCDDGSYVPRRELGHHGLIEFGNRTLTFVLIFLAVMVFLTAVRTGADKHARMLALVAGLGIPFQGVIGGITVLTDLNPWVVALHLLLSLALVVILTKLLVHITATDVSPVAAPALWSSRIAFVAMLLVCWLGTIVTGAGPHAGDAGSRRNNLDIESVARLHGASVWVTVAFTLAALVLLRRGSAAAAKWALLLLVVELAQGAVGYYQYFNGVPILAVLLHMLGAGVATAAASALFFTVRKAD